MTKVALFGNGDIATAVDDDAGEVGRDPHRLDQADIDVRVANIGVVGSVNNVAEKCQ